MVQRSGTSGTTFVDGPPANEQAFCHELAALRYPEVERILRLSRRKVALVPVGSTQAHGPHLPIGTDSLVSEDLARRAAFELAQRGIETVFFPALHYTPSTLAACFKGTASLSQRSARATLIETCVAAKRMGFDRVALVSVRVDAEYAAVVAEVASEYQNQTGEALVLAAPPDPGTGHAGRFETSLVLAIRPELVGAELARELPAREPPSPDDVAKGKDFLALGMKLAYSGNPAAAAEDEGIATLESVAQMVCEMVEAEFEGDEG